MPTTVQRIFNFSAGPAVMPQPVLEEAQRDLVSLPGVGMSILEISHRSKAFESILHTSEADIRALAGVPDDYAVLFLQGGASLQFSMVPMNLLPEGGSADYVVTGAWSQKAVKEAKRHGKVNIAATTEAGNFVRVPDAGEINWDASAAYAHVTSNNTIFGTQFQTMPDSGAVPLVCDASSDIFSRPIDVPEVRPHLRRRAEEPRPVGRDAGDHAQGAAGALAEVAPDDAELRHPRRERVDVQHAAVLRDLHPGPGGEVAEERRRPRRRCRRSTSARRPSSTPRSIAPGSTAATPSRARARA